MSSHVELPRNRWTRLLNSGPAVLLATRSGERANLCTIAWAMPIAKSPPSFALLVGRRHRSFELLAESGELAIALPTRELASAVMQCGTLKGRKVDKWAHCGLTPLPLPGVSVEGVAECCASIGARVTDLELAQRTGIVTVEAVSALGREGLIRDDGTVDSLRFQLLHHQGGARFYLPGEDLLVK